MGADRKVKVSAKPSTVNSGEFDFEMDAGNGKTDVLEFDKNKDKMKKSQFYTIKFTLHNEQGAKLKFDTSNPMWVRSGTACPPPGSTDPEFSVISVNDSTLTVENKDRCCEKYAFALNFLDSDNKNAPVKYDPIYDNKNGGAPGIQYSTVKKVLIGTAILAVAALALTNR